MSSTTPGEGGNTDGKEKSCQMEDLQQLTHASKEPKTVAHTADDEADGLPNHWDIGDAEDNTKRVIDPSHVYENLPHQTASSSTQPQPPLAPGIVTSEVKPAGKQTGRSKPSTRLEQRKQEGIGELKDTNIQLQNKMTNCLKWLKKNIEGDYKIKFHTYSQEIQSIKLKATNQRQLEAANTKLEQQLRDAQENIHHMAIQFNALGDEKQELETINKKFEQRLRKANEKFKASKEEMEDFLKLRIVATVACKRFAEDDQRCLQWQFDKQNKEKKKKELLFQVSEMKYTIDNLRTFIEELQEKLAKSEITEHNLNRQLTAMKNELEQTQLEKQRLSAHDEIKKTLLLDVSELVNSLEQTRKQLQDNSNELFAEKVHSKSLTDQLQQINNNIELKRNDADKMIHTLQETLAVAESQARTKKLENDESSHHNYKLSTMNEELQSKLSDAQSEVQNTNMLMAQRIRELENAKLEIKSMHSYNEDAEKRIYSLEQIQSTQDREQTELTEKLKDARTEIKKLKIKLQTAEDSNINKIAQLKQTSAELEKLKSNYIINQEIEAKLQEDMISLRNQDKNLREELESCKIKLVKTRKDHEKQLQSTQDQLDKTKQELKELQNSLRHGGLEREQLPSQDVHGLQKRLAKAETNEKLLESQLDQVRKELRDRNIELEDAKTSKLMGQRLTDNNPNITDLSDKNRPTKLAERYSELYDNERTDAFEDLDKIYRDEKKTIATLLVILTETATFCRKEAKGQMENLRKVLILETTLTASRGQDVPDVITKQLKNSRKTMAEKAGKHLVETYIQRLQQLTSASARDALRVETFLREAFTLCWLMSIQDPPVVFDRLIQHGEKFNIELYRSYTKAGPLVDFPVWPTMFLQEDGPVLYKGVAQGCNK